MQSMIPVDIRLRPAWHVALPFLLGAFMLGIIALAAQAVLVLAFSGLLVLWGALWSLLAWRGRGRLHQAIIDATRALPTPGPDLAVRLGPVNLKTRPKRPGVMFWSRRALHWQPAESSVVTARQQTVALAALEGGLEFSFDTLTAPILTCKALSGDTLTLTTRTGATQRFALPHPAVWSFLQRAWSEAG